MGVYRARLMPNGEGELRRPSRGKYVVVRRDTCSTEYRQARDLCNSSWSADYTTNQRASGSPSRTPLTKFRRSNRGKQPTCRRLFQTPCCEAAGTVVETCALPEGVIKVWCPNCATANVVQTIRIVYTSVSNRFRRVSSERTSKA